MDMLLSNLKSSDLNLLVAFKVLMEQRSISKAAEKMGLTQPAMSRTFGRIKALFDDEILVRSSEGYHATVRAKQIYETLEEVLPKINSIIAKENFDPQKVNAKVRICATDYASTVILPSLVKALVKKAPGICIDVVAWSNEAFDLLNKNDLDLVLWVNGAPHGFKSEILFQEKFVCIVREGHPLGNRPLNLKRYLEYPHVVVSIMKNQQILVEKALDEMKLTRRVLARVPYFTAAVWLLEDTDAILSIGKRLADKLALNGPFKVLVPPIEIKNYNYIQVWHPRSENDPLLKWIRAEIKSCSALD